MSTVGHCALDGNFPVAKSRNVVPLKVGKDEGAYHQQRYRASSVSSDELASYRDGSATPSPERKRELSDVKKTLKQNAGLIEHHVDKRIQLFFMQLITVYRTPYHFEWVEAQDQYGRGGRKLLETQAAHSSTLPALKAYPRDEWRAYERRGAAKPRGFTYLKYGHSYMQHNATIELPICVNQADTLIDGTHEQSGLRNEAIDIVNKVARGKMELKEAMDLFMEKMEEIVDEKKKRLDEKKKRLKSINDRRAVLEMYLERVGSVLEKMRGDQGYFDALVGVKIEHSKEEVLRRVVYEPRFKLIQKAEAIEGKIAREILEAQNQMLKKKAKQLDNLDDRLRYALLKEGDPRLKRIFARYFCTSFEQLKVGREENGRAFTRMRSFQQKHNASINKLKSKLEGHFAEISNKELNYRSALFKGLRKELNGWSQKEFSNEYRKKYSDAMSPSTVSRIEERSRPTNSHRTYVTPLNQRRKDITEDKARRIAATYKVDPGLFLPGVVSSLY